MLFGQVWWDVQSTTLGGDLAHLIPYKDQRLLLLLRKHSLFIKAPDFYQPCLGVSPGVSIWTWTWSTHSLFRMPLESKHLYTAAFGMVMHIKFNDRIHFIEYRVHSVCNADACVPWSWAMKVHACESLYQKTCLFWYYYILPLLSFMPYSTFNCPFWAIGLIWDKKVEKICFFSQGGHKGKR